MKATLIKIGNSQGIRIPKAVIEQCGLGDEIDMDVRDGELVLRAAHSARAGWDEAFAAAAKAEAEGEELLPGDLSKEWDETEWTW